MRYLRYILILMFAAALVVGCVREEDLLEKNPGDSSGVNDEREPVDLVFTIQMDDIAAAFENGGPETRGIGDVSFGNWSEEIKLKDSHPTRWDRNNADAKFWDNNTLAEKISRHEQCDGRADDSRIYSLAFFIVDMQLNVDGTRPPSWGRIVAYRLFLPTGYFYKDEDNISGYPIEDLPLVHNMPNGTPYVYGSDFNGSADSGGGLNGFARMDASGNLIPDDAANAGGYGDGFWEFDGSNQNSSKAVILTFKHDDPMHQTANNLEKLRRGDTWVLAIANFHELATTYKGHPAGWYVREVIDYWHRHKDDADFYGVPANQVPEPGYSYVLMQSGAGGGAVESTVSDKFMGFRFFADMALRQNDSDYIPNYNEGTGTSNGYDDDYTDDFVGRNPAAPGGSRASLIRHYHPIILASNDWRGALTPGENIFKLELTRMTTRYTFSISNHSESPLTVTDLKFSDNFAQAAAWAFPHDRTPMSSNPLGNYFKLWQGAPDPYSNKAMVPFRERVYPKMNHQEVFFECMTYESKDLLGTAPMTYDITLEYEGITREIVTRTADVSSSSTSQSDFRNQLNSNRQWATGTTRYYLLQNQKSDYGNRFIRKNGDETAIRGVEGSNLTSVTGAVETNADYFYVWGIEKVSGTTVRIKNLGSRDMYLKAPASTTSGNDAASFTFTENSADATIFTVANVSGYSGIYFYCTVGGQDTFPHMLNNGMVVCIQEWNDAGAHFVPYRVTITDTRTYEPLRKELKDIPLNVFDYETGIKQQLHEARRNDYIRAHIDVTYNPESQDLEYEVRDWDTSDNDLTFD